MTCSRDITVWCDGDGCLEWVHSGSMDRTFHGARHTVRIRYGWRWVQRPDGRWADLCPRCADAFVGGARE